MIERPDRADAEREQVGHAVHTAKLADGLFRR
jgi:hypothetical protein